MLTSPKANMGSTNARGNLPGKQNYGESNCPPGGGYVKGVGGGRRLKPNPLRRTAGAMGTAFAGGGGPLCGGAMVRPEAEESRAAVRDDDSIIRSYYPLSSAFSEEEG